MSAFPEKAKVVIVGLGGIVGASVAHHLIERGWDDIVGIDKSGIPTDIGSTAHASDFCYTTSHDFLSCWTTLYSIDFYEKMGHYARIGGIEVARVGDDVRMNEIRRKVASAKAFGTRARLIEPGRDQGEVPADRGGAGPGRPVGPRRRPGHPALADRRRQARRPGRGRRQAAGLRQHPGEVAGHRGRPHQGRRDHPRHDHGRPRRRLRRPLGPADRRDGRRGPAGHAGRPSADLLRAVQRVRGHRRGDRLPAAARPGQLRLHARHRRPEDRRGRPDRVGLLRGAPSAPRPSARPAREGAGPAVAVAARPRHGAGHRAAGAGDGADADPRRARLQRGPFVQRPACRRRPTAGRRWARARRSGASGTRSASGSRTARAWASSSPTG